MEQLNEDRVRRLSMILAHLTMVTLIIGLLLWVKKLTPAVIATMADTLERTKTLASIAIADASESAGILSVIGSERASAVKARAGNVSGNQVTIAATTATVVFSLAGLALAKKSCAKTHDIEKPDDVESQKYKHKSPKHLKSL